MVQKTQGRVEAVDRALQLLSLLMDRRQVSVTEAARELDVAPSTAHRLLVTLCQRDFAEQDDRRLYRPGPQLAGVRPSRDVERLTGALRPYLEQLYDRTGETVHLMTLDGTDVRFVDGIEGTKMLRVGLRIGARMPAYTTSGGKAMLAGLGMDAVRDLYADGLPPWPGRHAGDVEELAGELRQVHSQDFGVNHDESEPGVSAIGAAVTPAGTRPMGALTVAVPTARIADAATVAAVLADVCGAARAALTDAAS